jgi:hypothetical protein
MISLNYRRDVRIVYKNLHESVALLVPLDCLAHFTTLLVDCKSQKIILFVLDSIDSRVLDSGVC